MARIQYQPCSSRALEAARQAREYGAHDGHGAGIVVAAEWKVRRGPHVCHAEKSAQVLQERADKVAGARIIFVANVGQRKLRSQHVLRLESGIDGEQTSEAERQQPRADQQHKGQRNLGNDQG